MRVRRDALLGRLGMYIGEPSAARFQGLLTGFHNCLYDQGVTGDEYSQFRDWLHDKREFPTEGWEAKYLRDCHGNQERAILKYLDFVAEFLATHREGPSPQHPGTSPMTSTGTAPSKLLNLLMKIRRDTLLGRLGMYLGEPNVARFHGLIIGYQLCQLDQGVKDEEYGQFYEWLRDEGELPLEGWEVKYMRDCGGEPEWAIRKYLDLVAAFVETHRAGLLQTHPRTQ